MGRKVDVDDLVGTPEIADMLDVAYIETVNSWRRRYPDFPEPVVKLRRVTLWLRSDIEAWARSTGRLPD